jgi:4-amino-4-deoxy-L-arabinose transferase-like glycosyltransferase
LVASLLTFVVLFVLGRLLFGSRVALWSAGLLTVLPLDVFYATRAYADEALGLFTVAGFTAFLFAMVRGLAWPALVAGLLIGVGCSIKETAILVVFPLMLILLQYRVFPLRALGAMLAGLLIAFLAELGFWQLATGDALYRFHALTAMRQDMPLPPEPINSVWDWIPGPVPAEVLRSNNSFLDAALVFLTKADWGLLFYFVFPIAVWRLWSKDSGRKTLAIFTLSMTAVLAFFPVNFPHYTLQRDPRYFTLISVPAQESTVVKSLPRAK